MEALRAWGVRQSQGHSGVTVARAAAHRLFFPVVASGFAPLELWRVNRLPDRYECYLYRSRDDGATWQEVVIP